MRLSLEQKLGSYDNISYWHKDARSVFVNATGRLLQNAFGVKCMEKLSGKTDYDFPWISEDLAAQFRSNDRKVLIKNKTIKFLEIHKVASNDWGVLLTTKSPFVENDPDSGTLGVCVALPKSIIKLGQLLGKALYGSKSLTQSSYLIESNSTLTSRENEVLFFILRGKTAKEIARILKISSRTVEQYVELIKNKFKCRNKSELIAFSMENNYFHMVPESLINQDLSIVL